MTNRSEQTTFQQLAFFRNMTVHVAKQLPQEIADQIPSGQRNHIGWHLAHLWFVLERFVFHIGLNRYPQHDEHLALYGNGSSPENWTNQAIPSTAEWIEKLAAQPARIEQALSGNLDTPLHEPFTFANGYTVTTPRELLTYGIFHEGMHLSSIRSYAKQLQSS
jgi:hypothetical protein